MAFPSPVGSPTTATDGAATFSHTVNIPSGSAGDMLIIIICALATMGTCSATGWTALGEDLNSGQAHINYLWRYADGSEGTSVTVTSTGTTRTCNLIVHRFSGAKNQAPEKGTAVTFTSSGTTAANPPSLTPSWGAEDTLWLPVMGNKTTGGVSAAPTNYSNLAVNSGVSAQVASAQRQLNAASEDPGPFTHTAQAGVCNTLAIRPAPASSSNYGFTMPMMGL